MGPVVGVLPWLLQRGENMTLTLVELRAKKLPRLAAKDIFSGDALEDEKDRQALDGYLDRFAMPEKGRCIACGKELGGFFGSFQWGIAHGHGSCSCGWPVVAYHFPKKGPLERFELLLPVHPDDVERTAEVRI